MALSFLNFRFPSVPGVRCVFQTRVGGHSAKAYGGGNISYAVGDERQAVTRNRRDLWEALQLTHVAELSQVHGDGLIFEPEPVAWDGVSIYEGDGHATTRRGLGLMIKTADCQPILLTHRDGTHIMALHAGWRGNRLDFPASAVRRFCAHYALNPQDLLAVRGPSLGPDMAQFVNFDREWGADFALWFRAAEQVMDLWSLTRHQLTQAGLLPSRIFGLDMCTATMNELFFSYRCEKASGRQASVIWME